MMSNGSRTVSETPSLDTYTRAAEAAAAVVIRSYSTSFGLATRLLPSRQRRHVQNIYALVRVADEVVDGVAAEAGLDPVSTAASLDALENEVEAALGSGYSTDLIVHAFARTARATGFGVELSAPFFASMRADIVEVEHTPESFATYVYGSAEVVGLMCLAAFLEGRRVTVSRRDELQRGARALGAAFQKVNFLRDLAADFRTLGRSYFPDVRVDNFDEATKIATARRPRRRPPGRPFDHPADSRAAADARSRSPMACSPSSPAASARFPPNASSRRGSACRTPSSCASPRVRS